MRLLAVVLLAVCALTAGGVLGYRLIEQFSWLDSLYMTLMVLTTVGFGEVRELSTAGKVFTSLLMVFGIGTMLYLLSTIAEISFTSIADPYRARKRREKHVEKLSGHTIVCGFGQVGEAVSAELHAAGKAFVVIDQVHERLQVAHDLGYHSVEGDATQDGTLLRAGIRAASALVTDMSSDPGNLYVVLSACELNSNLTVVARASTDDAAEKMRRAGANEVVNPHRTSGKQIAARLLNTDFAQLPRRVRFGQKHLVIDEMTVGASLARQSIKDLERESNARIIALRRAGKSLSPRGEETLRENDVLLIAGTEEELQGLR